MSVQYWFPEQEFPTTGDYVIAANDVFDGSYPGWRKRLVEGMQRDWGACTVELPTTLSRWTLLTTEDFDLAPPVRVSACVKTAGTFAAAVVVLRTRASETWRWVRVRGSLGVAHVARANASRLIYDGPAALSEEAEAYYALNAYGTPYSLSRLVRRPRTPDQGLYERLRAAENNNKGIQLSLTDVREVLKHMKETDEAS